MGIELHHVSLLVANTQAAVKFYCGMLGLEVDGGRPDLGFPGAWLKVGERQIHLLELPSPDPVGGRPAHGGRDRHVAFLVDDLDSYRKRLETGGVPYTLSRSGRKALFCRDPDGHACELIEEQR